MYSNLNECLGAFWLVNGKDQSNIIESADEGHLYMRMCDQKQSWIVSLLIVESGTETTVENGCIWILGVCELCRSTTDGLHVLGRRPAQSACSLDKLTIDKSLKSRSVYRFTHNYCLHWCVPNPSFSLVDKFGWTQNRTWYKNYIRDLGTKSTAAYVICTMVSDL